MTSPRILIALVVAIALLATACSSASPPEATAAQPGGDQTAAGMCRTLDLLSTAGVPAGQAAASIAATDLADLTSVEIAGYGDLLVSAPREECSRNTDYADDIAYWLGF